jgi:hypothetical protein
MSKVICICPTHRDHRELAALANGHTFPHHDYASSALEDLSVDERPSNVSIGDPEQEIETILRRCRAEHIQAANTRGERQQRLDHAHGQLLHHAAEHPGRAANHLSRLQSRLAVPVPGAVC